MEKRREIRREMKVLVGVLLLAMMLIGSVSASTIQDFLLDMKAHPESYDIVVNRNIEEINFLRETTPLGILETHFNVPIVNVPTKGKNFVLFEIPFTEVGQAYAKEKDYSYIELNEDWLVDENQNLSYYIENDFPMFSFLVVYIVPQKFIFDYKNETKRNEQLDSLEIDGDGELTERDFVIYYLNKFSTFILNYTHFPIDSDYVLLSENEPLVTALGVRDVCQGFTSNSIYTFNNYSYFDDNAMKNLSISDSCDGNMLLSEVACVGTELKKLPIACPESYICSSGRCIRLGAMRDTIFTLLLKFLTGKIDMEDIVRFVNSWIFK